MSKIRILPPHEACKIAAGEVVERPANVVKELLENSLDAQATQIEIFIEQAGKVAIRILDNGHGMSPDDASLCFTHHATSKIRSVHDLDRITSFGFRGEALSSIASVSKVTLVTSQAENVGATSVLLEDGKIIEQKTVAGSVGTDILVRDLFYNLPARQKFLKQDDTEWRQILQVFTGFVFAYPHVHFKLFHNLRLVHNCPSVSDLQARVAQVWEADLAERMLKIEGQSKQISISGLISQHQVHRYQRSQIFCFVNRRLVKNHGLVKSLLKGYAGVLPAERYPVAVLFVQLPSTEVDINVHPRKEEVSFLHPRIVENLVTDVVQNSLMNNVSGTLKTISNSVEIDAKVNNHTFEPTFDLQYQPPKDLSESMGHILMPRVGSELRVPDLRSYLVHDQSKQNGLIERNYDILAQLHQTYILISKPDGLLLVDQHAAHERILYEQFRTKFTKVASVNLIFPHIINLNPQELNFLLPYTAVLKDYGIIAEQLGHDQLVIRAIPTYLKQVHLSELIRQLLGWLESEQHLEQGHLHKIVHEKLHAQMACKAAIKAGDNLSMTQMYELVDELEKVENRLTCPHGRPTIWLISLSEIEKWFKRKL